MLDLLHVRQEAAFLEGSLSLVKHSWGICNQQVNAKNEESMAEVTGSQEDAICRLVARGWSALPDPRAEAAIYADKHVSCSGFMPGKWFVSCHLQGEPRSGVGSYQLWLLQISALRTCYLQGSHDLRTPAVVLSWGTTSFLYLSI